MSASSLIATIDDSDAVRRIRSRSSPGRAWARRSITTTAGCVDDAEANSSTGLDTVLTTALGTAFASPT
jgi:hypothetical protein